MKLYKNILLFVSVALLLTSCITAELNDATQIAPFSISKGVVGIISNRQHALKETEDDFMSCIFNQISKGKPAIKVMDEASLRSTIFPWFEPSIAPSNIQALARLTRSTAVAEKLKELKLRYLIWIDGESVTSNNRGSMSCAFSPAGGGCLGFTMWDNNSKYEATIWDVVDQQSLGTVSAKADGTSLMPAVVIPIPLIARSQSAACHLLGGQLKQLLDGASG